MRYFIGFLITIGLLILLVVLLLTGGHGGNDNKQIQTTGEKPRTVSQLAAYADTDVVAQLIVDGEINSDQQHTALRVTVGREQVTYEQIQGYQGTVVNEQTFANNQSAYSNFLYAIGRAGFTLGDSNPRLANEKGYCPLGHRYTLQLLDGNHQIQRYWATNCGNSIPSTFKGNLNLTLNLFELQVPNYNDLISNIENF